MVVIRRAQESDIDKLALIYCHFHNFHAEALPARLAPVPVEVEETSRAALRRVIGDESAALFVAAAEGDIIVGFAEVYIRITEPSPALVGRRYGYLQSLMVDEGWRGQGIGRRLMGAVQRWVTEVGATDLELETWEFEAGPLQFYRSLGFRPLKRRLTLSL